MKKEINYKIYKVFIKNYKVYTSVEVTIIPVSGPIIRAEDSEENLYAAIDVVYDKLNKQLRRHKKKLQAKHHKHESIRYENIEDIDDIEEESAIKIERVKKFDLKPMNVEEAVLQMELVGHDFYVFKNSETDEIATVYKRNNGGYGLIEQE